MRNLKYYPNFIEHPGLTLKKTLDAYGLSQKQLAIRISMTEKHITAIIKGYSPITTETALKLETVFDISAIFWNNLQKLYDENRTRLNFVKQINEEIKHLPKFKIYNKLAHLGYVKRTDVREEKVFELHKFYAVSSLLNIPKTYSLQFRKSFQEPNKESLIAWLRCGEIEFRKENIGQFSRKTLINSISDIRKLTHIDFKESIRKLKEYLFDIGVYFVFIPYFENTYINGVVRWIKDNPVIQISDRNKYTDIFWFTVFHEICHILKHSKKNIFIDFEEKYKNVSDDEKEADEFARNVLIPKNEYEIFLKKHNYSDESIISFSNEISIPEGIVAGRLAFEGYRDWKSISRFREKMN